MNLEWILRIVLFGIVHWILAGLLIPDLASRGRIFGGHKSPWAILILFVPCLGSILYLLFHPQILNPNHSSERNHLEKRDKHE